MRNPDSFDAFYASTRDRLLHETYALTGDLAAARTAVRDAYVVAWHHWRKVGGRDDREAWLRPQAHGRARRRHTARLWHRDRSLDPEARETLDALARLSGVQRQLLVLTSLSPLPMTDIARTVGLTRSEAERELQLATAQFALHRDVPSTDVRALLEALSEPLRDVRWPRATIIRRNGAARRRTHTVAGASVAVLAMLASGSVVTAGSGAQPVGLDTPRTTQSPSVSTTAAAAEPSATAEPTAPLAEDALLATDQVTRYGPRLRWAESRTSDNLDGSGLVLPCQRARFADPRGTDALTRAWEGTTRTVVRTKVKRAGRVQVRKKQVTQLRAGATELVERSADVAAAKSAYATALAWYAGCQDPRTQLMVTRSLQRVGDKAAQFRYRTWGKQPATFTIGLARTGTLLVTTVVRAVGAGVDDRAATTGLAAAVNAVCATDGAGTCAGRPRSRTIDPLPIGDPPGLLSVVDLPPVEVVRGPWVGTDPVPARSNLAATRCDNTSFAGGGFRRALTRTFLFPGSTSIELGLTQTAGTLPSTQRARAFVEGVRASIRKCAAEDLGTSVTSLADRSSRHQELHAWALTMEVSDSRSFSFLMAIVRDGRTVSQVGFTPVGGMTTKRADFVAVSSRALQRLSNLPGHRR